MPSVGQLVVDGLAQRFGISLASDRGGYIGQGNVLIGDTTVNLTLYKSSPYIFYWGRDKFSDIYPVESLMNISGPSIVKAYRQTVNSPTSMIILSDSLSHRVGALSVKLGGSANGHNGIKSIIQALGGEMNFYRFRLGIGRNDADAAEYVMGRLSSHERRFWTDEGLDLILPHIEKVAQKVG